MLQNFPEADINDLLEPESLFLDIMPGDIFFI